MAAMRVGARQQTASRSKDDGDGDGAGRAKIEER